MWWNGRHRGLKIPCRKAYGFESRHQHSRKPLYNNDLRCFIFCLSGSFIAQRKRMCYAFQEVMVLNQEKIGGLIRTLRQTQNMTQQELAERIGVSDKAVSKWERGLGCPDVSLLGPLSQAFQVDLAALLDGDLPKNRPVNGNMRQMRFYVCPHCGALLTGVGEASLTCCGMKLAPLEVHKASEDEQLEVSIIEQEYFVSSSHPMTREHHIAFVAIVTGDTLVLRRMYPEWDLATRLPMLPLGTLYWYCTEHGLFSQLLRKK